MGCRNNATHPFQIEIWTETGLKISFFHRNVDFRFQSLNYLKTKCTSYICKWIWILVFNATFRYISAILWRPVSGGGGGGRSTRREPPTLGKQLVNFISCGCESSAPFLQFTKLGANPRYRLVWVVRSNDLTHWAIRTPTYICIWCTFKGGQVIIPTAHFSHSPLLRQPISPTTHYSDSPLLRQWQISTLILWYF